MGFLFGEPKLDREEFNQCLKYLEEHYKLTTFQEKEADIYNEALTQYMPSLATDSHSAKEMLKVAERFKKAAHLLLTRSKQLVSVPESERVQALFRQQEESHKKALQEEKKLLKRLRASGLTPSDIQRLIDKAFVAIASENWQPEKANET